MEWFIMENPIKMDVWGVPLFLETPIYEHIGWISQNLPGLPRAVEKMVAFTTNW